ncbi:hypothetical protein sscle_08g067450 [Sclerotinia sclerotiorum 1980 UF-70]|uniref:Uncharacterized protein n=1 Tax=Sclerotinia sclerotiorum (strain ATCC 18683 / 1980 / Ss-1) TaxID=665079 RepID=A0A1D9QAK9_SCLS1|nr:hypothetical protein sscle_08g067450 [Sclerotinia sclerotiorum 1980 UF-70]
MDVPQRPTESRYINNISWGRKGYNIRAATILGRNSIFNLLGDFETPGILFKRGSETWRKNH